MSTASPRPAALPLERVGRYQLVTELGQGALGPVFGARVIAGAEAGRLVALRRIRIARCAPGDVLRLVAAARAARRLRHSKLAAVLDAVASEREVAVVGEYVDGQTLSSLQRLAHARRSPLPPAVALRIGVEILHALRAVREAWREQPPDAVAGALHGGVTPDNVFVATFGDVLLAEVGVSAVAGTVPPFCTRPEILAYRSPELLRTGSEASVDERADVFSVGVVLWELLSNQPLFGDPRRFSALPSEQDDAALSARTLRDVQSKLIPALSTREGQRTPIAPAAVEVVERALRRDPATRYAGIDQMLHALQALGRDIVATTEQVAVAADQLGRTEVYAQRAALGSYSSARPPPSSPPRDSSRPTVRPEPPVREAAAVPASESRPSPAAVVPEFSPQPAAVEHFSQQEAPTFPAAQLMRSVPEPPVRKPAGTPVADGPRPPAEGSLPALRKVPVRSDRPPPPRAPPRPPARVGVVPGTLAFGEPLPPLPPLPGALNPVAAAPPAASAAPQATPMTPETAAAHAPPAAAAHAAPVKAPFAEQAYTAFDSAGTGALSGLERALPSGSDPIEPRRLRTRRMALVIGTVLGVIGLAGMLHALLRSAGEDQAAPEPIPSSAQPLPAVRSEAQTQAPVARSSSPPPAASTAEVGRAEPVQALEPEAPPHATPAVEGKVREPPRRPPPRDDDRPERRADPEQKAFRPRGI